MKTAVKSNPTPVLSTEERASATKRGARRWLLREIIGSLFVAALLFLTAGRWDWLMGGTWWRSTWSGWRLFPWGAQITQVR